jgi:hypothetical protein
LGFGGPISGNLYVGATGYFEGDGGYLNDLGSQANLPVVVDVTLLPGGPVIKGTVKDAASSAAISGATVTLANTDCPSNLGLNNVVETQSDGTYAIDSSLFGENVLSGTCHAYLMVSATGYLGVGRSMGLSTYPVVQDLPLVSSSGPLIIGTVRDRDTSQPIANAQVIFDGSASGKTFTDANGIYQFTTDQLTSFGGGISGTLYVGATGYFQAHSGYLSDLGSQPSLPVIEDFTLLPGGAVIQGVVRDASTDAGISGALINFNASPPSLLGGGGNGMVEAAADGSYAIDSSYFNESGVTSGFNAYLMVSASGYLGASRGIGFNTYPSIQDFSLVSSSAQLIKGTVVDRNTNLPVADARVLFYGTAYGTVFTDVNGNYLITLSQLTTTAGGISGYLYVGATGYFEAPSVYVSDLGSQATLPVAQNFTLLPGGTMIKGMVKDATTGVGIGGALVMVNANPASMLTMAGGSGTVVTQANGSYAVDSSYFNESGVSSDYFYGYIAVSASGYQGTFATFGFSAWPLIDDFDLAP